MRFQNRYKSYDQLAQVFEEFPLRILKFKNTKWKRVQRTLSFKLPKNVLLNKKKKYKLKRFKDHLLVKVNLRTWEKVKGFYQSGRKITNLLFNTFDQSVSNAKFRKSISYSKASCEILDVYRQMLLKPEFRLNIFLWRLNIFDSSYQASQAIHEKKVLVNDKVVGSNFLLSKGDIISLKLRCHHKNLHLKRSRLNFSPTDIILSFVEIDHYSNHIVIIKSLDKLGHDDLRFIRPEFCNLKKIKDYI